MATKQSTSFTVRETELLTLAFQCIEERPKIDFELMASKGGLKGGKSARDQFNKLYSKIVSGEKSSTSNGEGEEQSSEPSPKKKATPSKRKTANGGNEEDGNGENSSPTKKKKATPDKAKGKKKLADDDEVENDMVAVKSELVDHAGYDG